MVKTSVGKLITRRARELGSRGVDSLLWIFGRESQNFWNAHYKLGGTSGPGSQGLLADYKADFVNSFIRENEVRTVIDFGCGDGVQLSRLECPIYIGLDVSKHVLIRCVSMFAKDSSKSFFLYNPLLFVDKRGVFQSDLALSLDVIFHLVEDEAYEAYMGQLFNCAEKYVIIYSSNDSNSAGEPRYTRHRRFLDWVTVNKLDWEILNNPENPFSEMTKASFFILSRKS